MQEISTDECGGLPTQQITPTRGGWRAISDHPGKNQWCFVSIWVISNDPKKTFLTTHLLVLKVSGARTNNYYDAFLSLFLSI
jgi:hypothetical protein